MSQIDPWEKAADCERAVQAAADPQQKKILETCAISGSRWQTKATA